jgi:enterochelin esterase-like enzyme
MRVRRASFRSTLLGNERGVWLQAPASEDRVQALCVLLDGEYYVERMDAPAVIDALGASAAVRPFAVVYVSHVDAQTRWRESFCSDLFARSVRDELVPWAQDQFGVGSAGTVILGGLSLTGLAAAHAGLASAGMIAGVMCQSASFWWSDSHLVRDVRQRDGVPLRFRLTCGARETDDYVEHGSDLVQRTSQLDSNRAMRDALLEKGYSVSYDEFDGGHDPASWKRDLPRSLEILLPKHDVSL